MDLNINFLLPRSSLIEYIVVFELDSKQLCSLLCDMKRATVYLCRLRVLTLQGNCKDQMN